MAVTAAATAAAVTAKRSRSDARRRRSRARRSAGSTTRRWWRPHSTRRKGGRWAAVLNDVGVGAPCYLYALWRGFGWSAVVFWLLPFLLGSATLVFAFDYLPHRPHKVTTDPYRATSVLRPSSRVATAILLSQNLHNIHHLAPNLPFYQYAAVWRASETELTKRGTRELPLLVHPRSAIL